MKIHFIKLPNRPDNPGIFMPDLGIGILTALLREQEIGVGCVDLKPLFLGDPDIKKLRLLPVNQAEEGLFELAKKIVKGRALKKFEVLGFSLDEETDLPLSLTLIRFFKELTQAVVLLGGSYKFSPAILEDNDFIDFIIKGDATISLPMFLRKENPKKIPGLMYRQGHKVVANPYLRQAGNTDTLPDYTDFNIDDYRLDLSRSNMQIRRKFLQEVEIPKYKPAILPYQFIKGCPNRCSYCFCHPEKIFETTPPEKVADNLQFMKEKYKVDHFIFLNNEFNPVRGYAEGVLSAIKERRLGITWGDSVHPALLNEEIFSQFQESGCAQLYFGLESLSPRILKLLNRPGDPSRFAGLLRASHEKNIFNGANFMVGVPFETADDIRMTEKFIVENKKYYEYYNLNILRIYPEFVSVKDPRRLKIKIRDLGSVELRNPEGDRATKELLNYSGINKRLSFYSYDEINGLKWEKKRAQDLRHLVLLKTLQDDFKKAFFGDLRFSYYLMKSLKKKEDVLKWYEKVKKDMQGKSSDRR